MIYVDSAAAVKLVYAETESAALRAWLEAEHDGLVASRLLEVELMRTVRRRGGAREAAATDLLRRTDLVTLSDEVVRRAGTTGTDLLRSLDALHLATAELLGPLVTTFLTYDHRLAAAALEAGFVVASPL